MEYCKKPFNQNECKDNKCPVRHICDYYIRQKQITVASNTSTKVRFGVDGINNQSVQQVKD